MPLGLLLASLLSFLFVGLPSFLLTLLADTVLLLLDEFSSQPTDARVSRRLLQGQIQVLGRALQVAGAEARKGASIEGLEVLVVGLEDLCCGIDGLVVLGLLDVACCFRSVPRSALAFAPAPDADKGVRFSVALTCEIQTQRNGQVLCAFVLAGRRFGAIHAGKRVDACAMQEGRVPATERGKERIGVVCRLGIEAVALLLEFKGFFQVRLDRRGLR